MPKIPHISSLDLKPTISIQILFCSDYTLNRGLTESSRKKPLDSLFPKHIFVKRLVLWCFVNECSLSIKKTKTK